MKGANGLRQQGRGFFSSGDYKHFAPLGQDGFVDAILRQPISDIDYRSSDRGEESRRKQLVNGAG